MVGAWAWLRCWVRTLSVGFWTYRRSASEPAHPAVFSVSKAPGSYSAVGQSQALGLPTRTALLIKPVATLLPNYLPITACNSQKFWTQSATL